MSAEPEPVRYEDRMAAAALERGDTGDAAQWMRIRALVDQAPPFTQAQRDQLRILLRPSPAAASDAA